ncbi:MAG: M64 family metallopeptidase [Prevotella sp.]|jgi:hypothetical protein|nr:M64 family metallopeptidase [Prevotella sp.]MDR2001427.1 M64 family metallopeptidase [Prevotella sp.]
MKVKIFSLAILLSIVAGGCFVSCNNNEFPPLAVVEPNSDLPDPDPGYTSLIPDPDYPADKIQYDHGDYIVIQQPQKGNGIAIVFVGDGFSRDDNKVGGNYEKVCRELAAQFLKTPIIKDFKDYFGIYAAVAESGTSGISAGADNFFGSNVGMVEEGVAPDFNAANVFTCEAIPGLAAILDRSWIFIGNGMIGGYATFGGNGNGGFGVYSVPEGISYYWMIHEFVGHAFASLADEYDCGSFGEGYYGGVPVLTGYQSQGMLLNCSVTDDGAQVPWAKFIGREGYEEVGLYKGGFSNCEDIWRPEQWSIMVSDAEGGDYAGMYFDAPSRWLIYKRIRTIAELLTHEQIVAGQQITKEQDDKLFEEFLEYDKTYNVK